MADLEAPGGNLPDPCCGGCFPLSKKARTILNIVIVAILWSVTLSGFFLFNYQVESAIIQLVAYFALGCLFYFSTERKKRARGCTIFVGSLVIHVVVISSLSSDKIFSEIALLFAGNVLGLSWYCVSMLYATAQACAAAAARQEDQEEAGRPVQLTSPFHIDELPREFSYAEIRSMTQDFGSMVGQGGSAQVFRGHLGDGAPVAVKRIAATGDHPAVSDADFRREISIVASVHHRSLVRLLGYGLPRGGDRFLVYPFFDNGSLDAWLFRGGGEERRRLLPWPARRRIAVDVARALAYLHHECCRQILHLDVKPANILLDGDLRAHLSDFGISMSVTRGLAASIVDTRGRGTFGYMAPEMLVNAVSAKSDVFSYGMTLLELVGGRRNFDRSSTTDASTATPDLSRDYFPCIVREKMARGELTEAVDAAMGAVDEEEVEAVVKVALCCIQRRRDMRPSMLTVVDMLEGRVAVGLPPESRPSSAGNISEPLTSSLTHGR